MKLTADAAVTLQNVPGMHKMVLYTSPQNFIIRSLDLQKLPNKLVPCLAPKSVHTVVEAGADNVEPVSAKVLFS